MFGDAKAYEKFMGRWSRLVAARLVEFAKVPQSGSILDIGSGTGALAFSVARSVSRCHVVGIEPSKEYVAFANANNPFPGRVRFEVGDAQQMSFPSASFAACLSLLVFNFIPDPAKALGEVRRVTTPGGRIAAAVWDYGGAMQMLRVFWDAAAIVAPRVAEKADEKHMPLCRRGELTQLWKDGGLADLEEQPLDITMRFKSFADYWDPFLLGQGPAGQFVRKLSAEQVQALREEVRRKLPGATGSFTLTARVWAVRGTAPG